MSHHHDHCESCLTPIHEPYEEYCVACNYQICPHCVREIDGEPYCEPCGRELTETRTLLAPVLLRLDALFGCDEVEIDYDVMIVEKRYTGLTVTYENGKMDIMDVIIDPDFPDDEGGVVYTTRVIT